MAELITCIHGGLYFAVGAGTDPPSAVRVILNDRLCEKEYRSELVEISPGLYSPARQEGCPSGEVEIQGKCVSCSDDCNSLFLPRSAPAAMCSAWQDKHCQ